MRIRTINIIAIIGLIIFYSSASTLSQQCSDRENIARETIRKSPSNANAYYDLGYAFICDDRLSESLAAYRQGVGLDANFTKISATEKEAEAYTIFARALGEQNKFDEAIAAYSKAIELTPNKIELYNRSASLSIKQNNWEAATTILQQAIKIDPKNSDSYRQTNNLIQQEGSYQLLAKVAIKQNKIDEALNIYLRSKEKKSIQIMPKTTLYSPKHNKASAKAIDL